MNAIAPNAAEIMEAVIARGDLAKLSPDERAKYYARVCESIGLNPLTRPFEYITLNGKLTLYARKDCTDQLRSIYGVSVTELTESEREGVFIVTAKVATATRTDASKGAVNVSGLKGEALANALMKAETKAKRRATLSICGLGFLDETEIEDIPAAAKAPAPTSTVQARDTGPPLPPIVKETEPAFDSAGWLREAEDALSACETAAEVFHVNDEIVNPARDRATKEDWDHIQTYAAETLERITSPDEPENVLAMGG